MPDDARRTLLTRFFDHAPMFPPASLPPVEAEAAAAADLSKADAIAAWHKATIDTFGGVDLLFCNTGGPPAGAEIGRAHV